MPQRPKERQRSSPRLIHSGRQREIKSKNIKAGLLFFIVPRANYFYLKCTQKKEKTGCVSLINRADCFGLDDLLTLGREGKEWKSQAGGWNRARRMNRSEHARGPGLVRPEALSVGDEGGHLQEGAVALSRRARAAHVQFLCVRLEVTPRES